MGDSDSNNEDDELFDLFMLNEIGKQTGEPSVGGSSSGGGCLASLVFMIAVPAVVVGGIISMIM